MLCFVSFARRCLSRLRRRYWVLARSVCRIERRRLRLGLWVVVVLLGSVSADEAARSSIVSIFRPRNSSAIDSFHCLALACLAIW